jgi:hypothetical protein
MVEEIKVAIARVPYVRDNMCDADGRLFFDRARQVQRVCSTKYTTMKRKWNRDQVGDLEDNAQVQGSNTVKSRGQRVSLYINVYFKNTNLFF